MEESRKQFEEFIKSRCMSAMKREGRYVESATRFSYEIWQASRATIEIELPHIEIGYEMQEYFEPDDVKNSIRAAGLKIKGE